MLHNIITFFKKDIVLTVAIVLAIISCFIVPPDGEYLGYIDFNTLILLFCLMMITEGLRELKFFRQIGGMILNQVQSQRGIIFTLVFLCFVSSMFITNDVALITFVPFGIFVLEMAGMSSSMCFTVTLMTIAANLGSMMTPIGNPQNLYLYSVSGFRLAQFLWLMFPLTVASAVMLAAGIWIKAKKAPITMHVVKEKEPINRKAYFYLVLFLLCLLSVAGVISKPILLLVIAGCMLFWNRHLFLKVDYSLLLTFVGFFIFVGNINRFEELRTWIISIFEGHERLVSILASQVISNVPAAVLLANYTDNLTGIIVGTNIGGLGTLIASMASLISYKQIAVRYPGLKKRYLAIFTGWNLAFLAVLYVISSVMLHSIT